MSSTERVLSPSRATLILELARTARISHHRNGLEATHIIVDATIGRVLAAFAAVPDSCYMLMPDIRTRIKEAVQ